MRVLVIDNVAMYGPYTDDEAEVVGKQMRSYFDEFSEISGYSKPISIASHDMTAWVAKPIEKRHTLPHCPKCNETMYVCSEEESPYADCQKCDIFYDLIVVDDSYIVLNAEETEDIPIELGEINEQDCNQTGGSRMGILSRWWKRWTKAK